MNRDSRILLKVQITEALKHFFNVEMNSSVLFLIQFDENEKVDLSKEPISNEVFMGIERNKDRTIDLESMAELLTSFRNEIPLWIKIEELENLNLYKLTLSKRFRKKNVVDEWHNGSKTFPFTKI